VSVKSVLSFFLSFFFLLLSSLFKLFPWSQAASVATLPSALFFDGRREVSALAVGPKHSNADCQRSFLLFLKGG
jgi:hypothetical protein